MEKSKKTMTRSGLHPLWMQTFSFNLIVLNDTLGQLCSRCPLGKKSASMTWVMLRRPEIAPCTETHVFGLQNPVLLFLSHFIMCTSVHTFFKLLAHFYEAKTTSTKIIKMDTLLLLYNGWISFYISWGHSIWVLYCWICMFPINFTE